MAISLVGVTSAGHSTGTITVSTHASTQVGDIVLAFCQRDEGYGTAAWTGNPFTLLRDVAQSGQGHGQLWVRQATAAGATSYSYTDTNSGNTAGTVHLVVVRGAVLPTATNTAGANNASSGSPTSPSVGSGTLDMLVCGWGALRNYSSQTWGVASSGLTSLGSAQDPDGYWGGFVAYAFGISAGSKTISLSPARTTRALSIYLQAAVTEEPKSGSDTTGSGSESLTSLAVAVSGSDSGTGSEQGFIASLKSGSDTATGSESGYVAQPSSGEDSGTGAEQGTIAATTSGSDAGTGSEAPSALTANTEGLDDTGEGTEQGYITLPGSDTATGAAALVALNATTSGTDTATGSEGGYVEELFGNLVVGLWAIDPDTGAATILPDFVKVDLSRERNGPGSITVEYPVDGLNFAVLRDTLTDDRDLEIEVWTLGQKTGALRGFLQEASGDDVAEAGTWTFAGGFGELLLSEAAAWPAPIITTTTVTTTTKISDDPAQYQVVKKTTVGSSAGGPPVTSTVTTTEDSGSEGETVDTESTNGDLEFDAVTPGELAIFLVEQAQDRGTLENLELGFTDSHDSAGTAWPKTITTKFSPGSSYDSILDRLVDFGLAEWGVTWTGTAYRLDLWVIFGRGQDRTLGVRPIILRKGRNLLDAPRKWSVRESGTALLAAGSEGVYEDAEDASAEARRGRRIERFASANNLEDHSALQGFAQNQLEYTKAGQLEVTHGIGFLPGEPRPSIAFDIGDWVYSQTVGGLEKLRVVQWTLSFDAGDASGTVTLNDTITDALSRLKARIDNLISGDTVVGTSEGSGGQDTSVPLPPEVVSADSIAFLDGTLGVRAAVTVALNMPVLNVDGTVITDLDQVVVEFALASSPDVWNAGITKKAPTGSAVFTAPAGQTIHIRAAVLDRTGNRSVWSDPPYPITTSDDDIPPPIPSAPTVSEFLGTVRIAWDGLDEDGVVMSEAAIDFDYVEVHMDPGSLFTPDESTLVGRLYGAGTTSIVDLPYGVEQFVRLVAVDWSGNKSDPSGQDSATPAQVVSDDVFDGAVGTAKLADLAVVTAKVANAAINDAKIANLSVGKLTAGNLQADVILSTGGIKTASSGTRVELDSAGLRLYNGSNTVVDLKTSNGSALVVGEFRTSLTGQRIVFNPGGALADQMNFYPNAAGDFARIMSRTAPSDGSAAILIDGGAANGTSRGRLGAYKGEAFVSYVTNDAGGDTSAGFSRTAVSCSNNVVLAWAQTQVQFDRYSGSTRQSGSGYIFKWVSGEAGSNVPTLVSENNSGIKLDAGAVASVNGAGSSYVPHIASAYPGPSSRTVKTDFAELDTDQLLELFRSVDAPAWRYLAEIATDDRIHFGPIAEDVAEVMPDLVTTAGGGLALDTRDLAGVTWALLHRLVNVLPDWLLRGDPPPQGDGS